MMKSLTHFIDEVNSVFVHLGATIPRHLKDNLSRHKALFPMQQLTLIVDRDPLKDLPEGIRIFKYEVEKNDLNILEEMDKVSDFHFRDGFWKYTFLRLFALEKFHKTHPDEPLLHIESDVILMPNFPWEKFKSISQIAWLNVNSLCDVASLVFSPNSNETHFFVNELRKIAKEDPSTTDMLSMREFAIRNPSRHIYLPSLTDRNSRVPDAYDENAKSQIANFQGYFDPSAIGMWNFGQDPKNLYGFRNRFHLNSSYDLDPSKSEYFFEDSRLFDSDGLDIYSLHVHSKFLPLFSVNWAHELDKELRKARGKRRVTMFNLRAFIGAIKDRKLKDNVWLVFASIPGIKYLRKVTFLESLKEKIKDYLKIKM
jgi:hypothetical protein